MTRRRVLVAAAVAVLLVVGAGIGYYLHVRAEGRDVKGSSSIEFTTTAAPAPPKEPGIAWPTYGRDPQRLRVATGVSLAPPFHRIWTFRAGSLLEFPPAVAYGRLYFASNAGIMYAVGAKNGRKAWSYDSGRCVAASPAVDAHMVFEAFLNRPPCNRPYSSQLTGSLVAFTVGSGRVLWHATIGPSETSPVVVDGLVLVGDWRGRVYAFDEKTGARRWETQLSGEVKGGVAVSGKRVYVGDYAGHVTALALRTGKVIWQASAQPRLGGIGNFYSTPAVAYDRVYIGGTDGKVYSYGATSGKLRWSQSTGGYVYSSPAVWHERIFAGSYSHSFFAFDAATGAILWQFRADGPISGSPTVIAGRVYFATLAGTTYALDAATGHLVWRFPDGKYSPVVADADHLYLVGYTRLYALAETP